MKLSAATLCRFHLHSRNTVYQYNNLILMIILLNALYIVISTVSIMIDWWYCCYGIHC